MNADTTTARSWVKKLPRSKMMHPERRDDFAKYVFWRVFTPVHPFFRELCMPVRKMRGRLRRQDYLFGTLVTDRSFEAFVAHLFSLGYRRHPVAWRDPDQLVSLRLLENFHWQYHLRIYKDGEVRGHYEHTPESFPFRHLKRINMQERRAEFMRQLHEWVVPTTK